MVRTASGAKDNRREIICRAIIQFFKKLKLPTSGIHVTRTVLMQKRRREIKDAAGLTQLKRYLQAVRDYDKPVLKEMCDTFHNPYDYYAMRCSMPLCDCVTRVSVFYRCSNPRTVEVWSIIYLDKHKYLLPTETIDCLNTWLIQRPNSDTDRDKKSLSMIVVLFEYVVLRYPEHVKHYVDNNGYGLIDTVCITCNYYPYKMESWIRQLIDIGCDVNFDGADYAAPYVSLVQYLFVDLVERFTTRDVVNQRYHVLNGINVLMMVLFDYATTKDRDTLRAVHAIIGILIRNGIDLGYTDRDGCNAMDYVRHYCWKDILRDYLPLMPAETQNTPSREVLNNTHMQSTVPIHQWVYTHRYKKEITADDVRTATEAARASSYITERTRHSETCSARNTIINLSKLELAVIRTDYTETIIEQIIEEHSHCNECCTEQ